MAARLIVFTDLDGSLLDQVTFRYEQAKVALAKLAAHNAPLVFCTSKTRAEVEPLQKELQNSDPFIIENGGAVYLPNGYFAEVPSQAIERDGYLVIEFGIPYSKLREGLRTIEQKVGVRLKGFGDMSIEEVVSTTGLSPIQAMYARKREYDEPFLVSDPTKMFEIRHEASQLGLMIVIAGRFAHLVGGTHKGPACRVLIELYKKHFGEIATAAFGDSLNDLPMLELVDHPFLVEQPGGGYQEGISFKGLTFLQGVGPSGWGKGVLQLLGDSPNEI